jgi:predicted membrane-bound dolichyl-phosphate-mannose-protein mannosyltransferase
VLHQGLAGQYQEGNQILYENGSYKTNLAAARTGILPFFVIGCAVVWFWGRFLYGHWIALAATALFSTLPPILANAGLTTTDMAVTAFLAASLHGIVLWLEKPSLGNSVWMGAATGLAILSKLSAVVFLLPCVAATLLLRLGTREPGDHPVRLTAKQRTGIAVSFLAFFLIVWTIYRFSVGPFWSSGSIAHTLVDRVTGGKGSLHDLGDWVIERPLPAPELIAGLKRVIRAGCKIDQ